MHRAPYALAAIALLSLTGCAATSASVTTKAAPAATHAAAKSAPTKPAGLGDTINLKGEQPGDTIAVTLVKIVDPARGSDEFNTADPGKRLVGVQLRIRDTGSGAYSDDPDNDAVLIDAQGQQYTSDLGTTISAGPGLNSGLNLASGDATLGFEVFEVPSTAKPAKVQYQLDSGMSGISGEWTLAAK